MKSCLDNGGHYTLFACQTQFKDPDSIIEAELMWREQNKGPLPLDKVLNGERNKWFKQTYQIVLQLNFVDGKFRDAGAIGISKYLKNGDRGPEKFLDVLIHEYKKIVETDCFVSPHLKRLLLNRSAEELKNLPAFRIISAILSRLSRDFAGPRKKGINKGMASDIMMISHILPYVDACFVDDEMYNCIRTSDKEFMPIEYKERIYSLHGHNEQTDIKGFVEYLKRLEKDEPECCHDTFKYKLSQISEALDRQDINDKNPDSLKCRCGKFLREMEIRKLCKILLFSLL